MVGWLEKNGQALWREDYGYNRLGLYTLGPGLPVVVNRSGDHVQQASIGGADLEGYDLPVQEARPGDVTHMAVYLRMRAPFTLTVSLADARGRVLESHTEWIAQPRVGMARVRFDVPTYVRTPPGEYHFVLSSSGWESCHSEPRALASSPSDGSLSRGSETLRPAQGDTSCVILGARLRIAGTPGLATVASVPNPRDLRLGQSIHLVGFQAVAQVKPGASLPVRLYWRTPDKIKERYTVFVQLVGAQHNPKTNGPLWAGHDSEPLDGGYPATQWFVNTTIADTHVLAIPPETPPGEYELWAGMYTQPDIKRLPVHDALGNLVGDHIVLEKVQVIGK